MSLGFSISYALDTTSSPLPSQTSTSFGSNSGQISFLTNTVYYINKNNDSEAVGNYFSGSYYESQFGFFRLNWSEDMSKNVRIVGSTNKCPSGYGYKLG